MKFTNKLFLLIFMLLITFSNKLFSQYFDLGQEPASIKWFQINNNNYRIIFSKDFEKEAIRMAKYLNKVISYYPGSIGYKPEKINIIIHNRSVISNAYAAWTPSRMEYFTSPPQTTYGQDWLEQLCLHEYRHISQMGKMKTGAGKWIYRLFGQQGTACYFGLFIPSWFMEGDAVTTETAYSKAGRGRIPDFEMPLKVQILEKKLYNFDKASFGSYKDYVPGDYTFGYLLVASSRIKYGYDLWDKATSYVAFKPYTLSPLSKGLKKYTGKNISQIYKETFKFADSIWKHSSNYQYDTNFQVISPKNKVYTSYEQPYFINDTTFCAIKYGLQHEKHFVIISGKNEKKLYTPGYFNPIRLATSGETIIFSNNKKYEELIYSTNGKYITWSEVQYDKRWAHQTWSIIKKYDIDKGKIQKLTKYTKYFAPAISPNGQLIAVSEILPEYKFSLVIIDAYKGNEIKRLSLPHNEMLITPSWSPDNKQLYCIAMDKDGNKGILKINYDDLKYEYILNPSHNEISRPLFDGKFIFFNGSYDGISNIYALNPENYKIYRVSSAKYGALYPSVLTEKNKIAFSNYTNNGYQIVVVPYDTSKWSEINYENISYLPIAETITNQELNLINNNNKIDTNYTIKKYSKLLHLFHFHSWMPFYYGDVNEIYPGITLMSQNILSTAFLVLNYGYNYNEKKSVINSSFIYKGFYPIIKIKQSYGGRKSYFSDYNTINQIEFNWNEAITSLNINIPLNLTKSKWFRSFTPYTEIQNIYITDAKHNAPFNGSLQALSVGFIYRNLLKTAERDLRPRWGQMIDFNYISSLNANLKSKLFSINTSFLTPGLIKHNSLKLSYSYQYSFTKNYSFPLVTSYPRGFSPENNENINKVTADYRLPLIYPDLSLGGLLYIKRIKTNIFFDYAKGQSKEHPVKEYISTGNEITFDIVPARVMLPAEIGCRYIYIPSKNKHIFQFMFSMNLDSF